MDIAIKNASEKRHSIREEGLVHHWPRVLAGTKIVGLLILSLVTSVASAQGSPNQTGEAETVALPVIATNDPDVLENGYKFFVFHRPSVSFEQARTDITQCRSFMTSGAARAMPGFVPWVEVESEQEPVYRPHQYGLVGAVLGAITDGPMRRGRNNTVLRRCMGTRGYVRYAVPEAAWNALNRGSEQSIITMQARIAAGPRPPQPEVSE